tara:strand:+ start:37110 stop:37340 length:231 start_codon:yes stop_codon:yes gene_type:complete
MIFITYYVIVTVLAIAIFEREVRKATPTFIGSVWRQCALLERLIACSLPIYREVVLMLLYAEYKKPKWFPNPIVIN